VKTGMLTAMEHDLLVTLFVNGHQDMKKVRTLPYLPLPWQVSSQILFIFLCCCCQHTSLITSLLTKVQTALFKDPVRTAL
jgi:hypothetical protein